MTDLFEQVKKDLDARNELGWKIYKKPMVVEDDRDFLRESYEEKLDDLMYTYGAMLQRQRLLARIMELEAEVKRLNEAKT